MTWPGVSAALAHLAKWPSKPKITVMISPATIRQIVDTVRIEEVVGDFVSLKRRGANLFGLCPFHGEKTPSFSVSPGKNIFKCFGCGRGGDSVTFIMEHEHYTYPEALRYLAAKYNIPIEERELTDEERQAAQKEESLYIINEFALKFFQQQLFETEEGRNIGLSYFKERGFNEETIRRFGLGYAPAAGDSLYQAAIQAGYKEELLRELGLITQNKRDFFRERVVFPIFNLTGKPMAFAGRQLRKNSKSPKYINSPESPIYDKSRSLYGISLAQRSIRKQAECLLVEGYTDVISLHQAGLDRAVASSGTSLTQQQVHFIRRFTPNLTILYDGDAAGVQAAIRGLNIALEQDVNVKVAILPEGEDPDSYLRKVGSRAFEEYLREKATDFLLFKTRLLLEKAEGDPLKKAEGIKDLIESLALLPDPIKRAMYVKEAARLLEMEEQSLVNEVNKKIQKRLERLQRQQASQKNRADQNTENETEKQQEEHKPSLSKGFISADHQRETDLLRMLILHGNKPYDEKQSIAQRAFSKIGSLVDLFQNQDLKTTLLELWEYLQEHQSFPTANYFLAHPNPRINQLAKDILFPDWGDISPEWEKRGILLITQEKPEENHRKDCDKTLAYFLQKKYHSLIRQNMQRIQSSGSDASPEELEKYLLVHNHLLEQRKIFAEELGMVVPGEK